MWVIISNYRSVIGSPWEIFINQNFFGKCSENIGKVFKIVHEHLWRILKTFELELLKLELCLIQLLGTWEVVLIDVSL